jgi:predicted adenine nucleotide alpha hydrolase (AANH) superfamily ATPase
VDLLLHSCCGPCACGVLPVLASRGLRVAVYFANPNIHPEGEYVRRLDHLRRYAEIAGVPVEAEAAYEPAAFLAAVGDRVVGDRVVGDREVGDRVTRHKRCHACYTLRLGMTAARARALGAGAFTTTLLVSPYQDHEAIRLAGERAAQHEGLVFLYQDFRPFYRTGMSLARSLELYRQKYCGCVFSARERNFPA